jgi:hypothetical protein
MGDSKRNISIIDFTDEFSEPIKTLHYEWLEKYFVLKMVI